MQSISEKTKRIPVVYEADVVVAGSGVSGLFAALSAARSGAETLLIDRFGSLGGNIGPGIIIGGSLDDETDQTLQERLPALSQELSDRVKAAMEGVGDDYAHTASAVSYVASQMMEEAGGKTLLSTYTCDPVMEDGCIRGVFIENASGRQAVTAKVVIDGTGEARLAERAGAPVVRDIHPKAEWAPIIRGSIKMDEKYPLYNEAGVCFWLGDVDWERFRKEVEEKGPSPEDRDWLAAALGGDVSRFDDCIIAFLRRAWEAGDRETVLNLEKSGLGERVKVSNFPLRIPGGAPSGYHRTRTVLAGELDTGNGLEISRLENAVRKIVFEGVRFYRKYVPGFEKAHLLFMSPYLGSRGGPFIEGRYTLTIEDLIEGKRFDDVLYVYYLETQVSAGVTAPCDIPYRILLPKGVEGLMAVGTSAAYQRRGHDPCFRARPSLYCLGEAAGVAAALAVKDGIPPAEIDVRKLQSVLIEKGFYLGDENRLRELKLV